MNTTMLVILMFLGYHALDLAQAVVRRVIADRRNARDMEAFRCSLRS